MEAKFDQGSLEAVLKNQQWLGGLVPSSKDSEAFSHMKSLKVQAVPFPNLFAWFALVNKFNENVRQSWPDEKISDSKKLGGGLVK